MEDHELRVALVLNGGVSLAVWMGGVVHELDLLRRASAPDGDTPGPQDYDQPVFDRWREQCRSKAKRRRVSVDVIAGTSAGGLNGALLATAIAHGGTLDPPDEVPGPWLRERWAALATLKQGQLLPADNDPVPSVLNGNYFLEQLTEALEKLASAGSSPTSDPVSLFVTASGLGRQQFKAGDAAQQQFTVEDHRFLYHFSKNRRLRYRDGGYEPEETNDFKDTDTADLAGAARASASFPVAFAPTLETDGLARRPPRARPKTDTSTSWLVDGGVLDNAPFGPVLDEVARRPAAESFTRYVLYVVPSSGVGAADLTAAERPEATAEGKHETPPRWTTAALSAFQYPREVDFRSDVEELERLLLEADASWSDTQQLFDACVADEHEARRIKQAAILLQPAYVRGRAAGGVWEAVTVATHNQATVLDVRAMLTKADVAAILAEAPQWVPELGSEPRLTISREDRPIWPWGTGPAERVLRLVLRSLVGRLGGSAARNGVDAPETSSLLDRLNLVNGALQRVMAVRDALTEHVERAEFKPEHPAADIAQGINKIFIDLAAPAALGAVMADLSDALSGEIETALAVEIVSRCTSARTPLQRSVPFRFLRLGPDVQLPILNGTAVEPLARELGDRILFGTQLGHFGAFGAEDWRRWDWLMGRLHGATHLGRLLGAGEQWIRETQQAILRAEMRSLGDLTTQLGQLSATFPAGPGGSRRAVMYMLDQLNLTDAGRETVRGVADRLIEVSSGPSVEFGAWTRALAGRRENGHIKDPHRRVKRWARWFTQPARIALWQRLTRDAKHDPAPPPPWPVAWPVVGLIAVVFCGLVVALAAVVGFPATLLGVATGATLAATVALAATRRWLDGKRRWLRGKVLALIPAANQRSRP